MGKPSYMLERGDQCEHFGEKKYQKISIFGQVREVSACAVSAGGIWVMPAPATEIKSAKKVF